MENHTSVIIAIEPVFDNKSLLPQYHINTEVERKVSVCNIQ
jgi:hypothetical protein